MKKTLAITLLTLISLLSSCSINIGVNSNNESSSLNEEEATTSFSSEELSEDSIIESSSEEVVEEDVVYFDSSSTNGDGTLENPYQSLSEISSLDYSKIHKILIKAGSSYKGQLRLENIHATKENPLIISSYGEGEKPCIDGNNLTGSGVIYIKNCDYVTVSNLEIYDSNSTEADRRGVLVELTGSSDKVTTYSGITLDNLYIHDIRGFSDSENNGMAMSSKRTGGIHLWSKDGNARSDGFTVKNCTIDNVSNVGIASWQKMNGTSVSKVSPYSSDFEKYAHLNYHLIGNTISNTAKNAIFVRNLLGGVIEENVVHHTSGLCHAGNSIVTSYVDGTIIQRNEGYKNLASLQSSGIYQDGCMLDADLQSKDTIWQYNYSHDNSFGLFLNCTTYEPDNGILDKVTVRYNLSVNDQGNKGIIYFNYASALTEVYNNTFITSSTTKYILQRKSNGNISFYNNLIYNRSSSAAFDLNLGSIQFQTSNNLIYSENDASISNLTSVTNLNSNGIYINPLLQNEMSDVSKIGYSNIEYYKLSKTSPVFGQGKKLTTSCYDIYGNPYSMSVGCQNK